MASVPRFAITLALACVSLAATADDLRSAHDRQDRAELERAVREAAGAAAKQPKDAGAHFRLAQAESDLAEVDLELHDKAGAKAAAEAGIRAAERAVALQPAVAEHHRILGTLCGQVIPAQLMLAFKYGRCARASIERALELDPKSPIAHLSRGVGNYYLPPAFGGGIELAIRDFRKAVELDPRSAEARLWLGIALRKARHHAEARKEILKSLELNPNRIWARQQLDKTPAQ